MSHFLQLITQTENGVRPLRGHAAPHCLLGNYFAVPWRLCKQAIVKIRKLVLFANGDRTRARFLLEETRMRGSVPKGYSVAVRIGVTV
jgi:hypothetical protein